MSLVTIFYTCLNWLLPHKNINFEFHDIVFLSNVVSSHSIRLFFSFSHENFIFMYTHIRTYEFPYTQLCYHPIYSFSYFFPLFVEFFFSFVCYCYQFPWIIALHSLWHFPHFLPFHPEILNMHVFHSLSVCLYCCIWVQILYYVIFCILFLKKERRMKLLYKKAYCICQKIDKSYEMKEENECT